MQANTRSLGEDTGNSQSRPPQEGRLKRSTLMSLIVTLFLITASTLAILPSMIGHAHAYAAAPAKSAVTTHKADNGRTGGFTNETILNTSNVTASQFGKRVSYPVDGQVYAQPLYLPNLSVGGSPHNVVFAATEHDSIYAFDADQSSVNPPLWRTSFLNNGVNAVSSSDVSCNDLKPEIGVTGTPVIDSSVNAMYVVSYTKENTGLVYRLHALNVTTGLDMPGSPIVIQATVNGKGSGDSINGVVTFNAAKERQRGALLQANGQIYIPFGSFCDVGPYHGWILSYSYNGSAFQQTYVYSDTANGAGGGLWGAGAPMTSDSSGNIYFVSGNGAFNLDMGGTEASDSFVKLSPQLQLQDYFSPFNQSCLKQTDADLGSGGAVIIPSTNEQIGAGKEGRIYVVDSNNMGKFTADPSLDCTTIERNRTDIDKVKQEFAPTTVGGIYSTPAYWAGPTGNFVYFAGAGDNAKAFKLTNGLLSTTPTSLSSDTFGYTGGNPVISSNGSTSGTGIMWTLDPNAILRAYDATNLATQLYTSKQNAARDALDNYVKFSSAVVANGEVFVGTQDTLTIYGLNPTTAPATTPTVTPTPGLTYNNIGISADNNPSTGNFDGAGNSYSQQALQSVGINPGDNAFYGHTVFAWPTVAPGQLDNYVANGQIIPVTPLTNATVVAFAGAATGGLASGRVAINYTDGTVQYATLGFSDWHLNGGLSFGNAKMATMNYYNTPTTQSNTTTYLLYTDILLNVGKTLKSVTLPTTVTGGTMHVFAVTTNQGPPPVAVYNNIATSNDNNPSGGNFDGTNSYSAQALQQLAITPGGTLSFNGVTFTWPNVAAGTANNYVTKGQQLSIAPVNGATTLAFLGAATGGSASGPATINYSDGTTQPFALGMSDWTLGGGHDAPSFGNQVVATTAYRNTPKGQQVTSKPVILYVDVALQAGKTVQSVIFPSIINGGQLHIFTAATKGGTTPTPTPTPGITPTPQTVSYNDVGVSDDSNPSAGNFDGTNSYSAQALAAQQITPGAQVTFNGVVFTWPNIIAGLPNDYRAQGQVVPVTPVANATKLAFLGSADGGATSGTATITYSDGTTQTFTLGLSDWTLGGGHDSPSFGNQVVATTAYRNTPAGKQTTDKPALLYTDVSLQAGKAVTSVTLPMNSRLHIFAITTGSGTAPTPTPTPSGTPTPQAVAYNNAGVSDDGNPTLGNFDGTNSYSAQALAAQQITPGAQITFNGVVFTWPNGVAGQPNDYQTQGQVVPVTPVANAAKLAFLGSATNGATSGTATITYSDGTTQTFTLGLSDWTLGGGHDAPSFGNQVVATTAYRNTPVGKQTTDNPVVLYTDVALQAGKTVSSVTLPMSGQLHVFTIATK